MWMCCDALSCSHQLVTPSYPTCSIRTAIQRSAVPVVWWTQVCHIITCTIAQWCLYYFYQLTCLQSVWDDQYPSDLCLSSCTFLHGCFVSCPWGCWWWCPVSTNCTGLLGHIVDTCEATLSSNTPLYPLPVLHSSLVSPSP